MRSTPALWLAAILLTPLGCGDSTPTVSCVPACRADFVCVSGACVQACNPPCGAGQRCSSAGGAPMCVVDTTPTDAGLTVDVAPIPFDTAGMDDVAPGADVVSATDVTAGPDAGGATDVAAPTDDLPPLPPCGMSGQPCCATNACFGGGQCQSGMCALPAMREMGECVQPSDCPAGQSCIGVQECAGARGCFRCGAPQGTGEIGTPCTGAAQCRTGVCSNGRCTIACPVGEVGDAMCNGARSGYTCTNILYRSMPSAPVTTIGVCNQSCGRGGDCPTGFVCAPLLNYLTDRMEFVCRAASTTATTPIGGACNPSMPTCQNVLCLPTGMNTGYCTGVCQSDTDCPAEAPVCDTLYLIRPSGREQVSRGCHPRR
ncbi:MAG: hypothetical protein R3A48_10495 [Polyangiales bacterium]